jgi:glutamate/tyrosine decarboxylase-like PLP-dependent enzyme
VTTTHDPTFESQLDPLRRLTDLTFHHPTPSWSRAVEAWFLGPKAENADQFEALLLEAFRDHVFWRRNFHPGDPVHIKEEVRRSPDYLEAMDSLRENFRQLLALLKRSVPFFSMRYQGHMNWELTIPSMLGYFAALLYNPNNVAFEASTVTTVLELLAGRELCTMLGYPSEEESSIHPEIPEPWGHITADGTIANIEALWAARNLKFFPLALQAALQNEPSLAEARDLRVQLCTGKDRILLDASTWELLNLKADEILALSGRLSDDYEISRDTVTDALAPYGVQQLGLADFARRFLSDIGGMPVFLVTGTRHYSWPKAAAVLGVGLSSLVNVPVDLDGRMDVQALEHLLQDCLEKRTPVYSVVVVIGSTEESAIDPVEDVLALREHFREQGLDFTVHADAAWGGYHASMVRPDTDILECAAPREAYNLPVLSHYAHKHLAALGGTDSITVDPHKSGYIPYPAGALCYRNAAMRDLVTFAAPVVFHGDEQPNIGVYGIEGSKAGAAAASVYLSHQVIRPNQSGYGRIISQAMFSAKRFYARLICMFHSSEPLVVVPLSRLPAEIEGGDIEAQVRFITERINERSNAEILEDTEAMDLLDDLGPDLNIVAYAFNFRLPTGELNSDLELANKLNQYIYDDLSINPDEDIYSYEMIVSKTDISAEDYGTEFIEHFKDRLGLGGSPGERVTILRSAIMDPWVAETGRGSFLDILEGVLRKTAMKGLQVVAPTQVRGY